MKKKNSKIFNFNKFMSVFGPHFPNQEPQNWAYLKWKTLGGWARLWQEEAFQFPRKCEIKEKRISSRDFFSWYQSGFATLALVDKTSLTQLFSWNFEAVLTSKGLSFSSRVEKAFDSRTSHFLIKYFSFETVKKTLLIIKRNSAQFFTKTWMSVLSYFFASKGRQRSK